VVHGLRRISFKSWPANLSDWMASCIAAFSSMSVQVGIAVVSSACMQNLLGVSKILSALLDAIPSL